MSVRNPPIPAARPTARHRSAGGDRPGSVQRAGRPEGVAQVDAGLPEREPGGLRHRRRLGGERGGLRLPVLQGEDQAADRQRVHEGAHPERGDVAAGLPERAGEVDRLLDRRSVARGQLAAEHVGVADREQPGGQAELVPRRLGQLHHPGPEGRTRRATRPAPSPPWSTGHRREQLPGVARARGRAATARSYASVATGETMPAFIISDSASRFWTRSSCRSRSGPAGISSISREGPAKVPLDRLVGEAGLRRASGFEGVAHAALGSHDRGRLVEVPGQLGHGRRAPWPGLREPSPPGRGAAPSGGR